MNNERKKTMIILILSFFLLVLILFFIYLEEKKYQKLKTLSVDRPVITNENTNFERPSQTIVNKNKEEEIYDEKRISEISDFLNNIYKLNRSKLCDLTTVIFKEKSGKISLEELYTSKNLEMLSILTSIEQIYNGNNIKNKYELEIEKYLKLNGKKQNIKYKIIKLESDSLNYFTNYHGIISTPSEISNNSDIINKILLIEENEKVISFIGINGLEDNKCNDKEIKEIIRVVEDNDYIYVYISYLKYNPKKMKEIFARDKAINNGPNYKLFLKRDKNKYFLDRYEYFK